VEAAAAAEGDLVSGIIHFFSSGNGTASELSYPLVHKYRPKKSKAVFLHGYLKAGPLYPFLPL
jgi:hypothetical protein